MENAMSLIADVSGDTFDADVIKSDVPVLLDFHAKWCGPCKAMVPTLTDVAKEYAGEVKILKIDIDEEPELAQRFGIRGVPTFIMMNKGEVQETVTGALTRGKFSALFERYLDAGQ
jgi:thioredoxin 1